MNYLKKTTIVLTVLVGFMISSAAAGEYFTDQGSMWTGGGLGFYQYQYRGASDPSNTFIFEPLFRYFPCKYLVVGPAFLWSTSSQINYSSYSISIGPEIGFAYGNNLPVIPYVLSSFRYTHSSVTNKSSGFSQSYSYGTEGYEIPIATGVIIPVVNGLGFQVEMGYNYAHRNEYYSQSDLGTFHIAFGICGIGNKVAISLMNLIMN
jgi:hypothetical protein